MEMFPLEIVAKCDRVKNQNYIGGILGVSHNVFTSTVIDEQE